MRNFTKIEKEFISYLVAAERGQRNVMCFLDKHLEKTVLRLNFENNTGEYLFEAQNATDEVFGWIINKIEDLQELIAVIIGLIVYLKNNGYIAPYSITPNKWSEVHDFGRGVQENLKIPSPFPDEEIVKLLIEYAFKEIVPLEPLKDLVQNKYVSQEDRRFNKQYMQAWAGIVVAILLGIYGIFSNSISSKEQKELSKSLDKKLDESIEPITKRLSESIEAQKSQTQVIQNAVTILESIKESESAHLKEIDKSLNKIDESLNETLEKRYNKQIQPTPKPRG